MLLFSLSYRRTILLTISSVLICVAFGFAFRTSNFLSNSQTTDGYAGALQGTFQVNTSGASTYSIPLTVPPGIKSMAPQLSFNYTSSSGNGLLGMGFSMSGLATIQRIPATMAQDGFVGSVNYNDEDRFALNGTRLVNVDGAYGENGTVYHTETESWTKVTSFGSNCGSGPCWFQVITKKGYTLEFGNKTDSQIESTNGKGIRIWAINKITDLNGNYISFTYQKDTDNGNYYPLRIDYTGNEKTGLAAQRSVQFTYSSRADIVTSYEADGLIRNTKRLGGVHTYLGSENVLNYQLGYQYSVATGRSQLISVSECDNTGKCLPATTFNWQASDQLFQDPEVLSNRIKVGQLMPLDINGDGLIDFANVNKVGTENNPTQLNTYLSNGSDFIISDSINFSNKGEMFFAIDLNGDGLGDITKIYLNDELVVSTFLSNGEGLEATPLVYNGPDDIDYRTSSNAFLTPTDLNADGLTDLVHALVQTYSNYTNIIVTNFLSNGTSFNAQATQTLQVDTGSPGSPSIVDVNGDGMSDLVYTIQDSYNDNTFQIVPFFSNEGINYTAGEIQSFPLYKGSGGQLLSTDVNGDGLGDLIYAFTSDSLYLSTYFSRGTDFTVTSQSQVSPGKGWLMAMEINGDGLTDLAYVQSAQTEDFSYISYLSAGNGFEVGETISEEGVPAGQSPMPLDINGDAKTDLLLSQVISGNISYFHFTKIMAADPYPDLIDSFKNGIGGEIVAEYKPLTNPEVYHSDQVHVSESYPLNRVLNKISGATYAFGTSSETQGATFPLVNVTLPNYVVSQYVQHDGLGANYPYSYFYRNAKVERNGRGWLGFQSQTMTDSSSGNITNTYYLQPFPFSGKTDSTTTYTLANELMSRNRTAYDLKLKEVVGGKLYEVNQTKSRNDSYDYGTFAYTIGVDYGYDEYGNNTMVTDWGDLDTETTLYTLNSYDNDTINWRIGYNTKVLNSSNVSGTDTLNFKSVAYDPATKNIISKAYWVDSGHEIDTAFVYDDYGNMLHSIDQAGDTTSVTYDATYHTFPSQHMSPPNQWGKRLTANMIYNPYFGIVQQFTDPNGSALKVFLDGIGRPSRIDGPNQQGIMTTLASITFLPNDRIGYSTQKSVLLDWEEEKWQTTESYYDGAIRNYKTITYGQDNQQVIQLKRYNSEDKVVDYSMPYFKDSIIYWAHILYDDYERIEQVELPKSANSSLISKVNYQGKSIQVTHAFGTPDETEMTLVYDYYNSQRKYIEETNANDELTQVSYDLLGRVTQVFDPQMISSQLWYDGLNRRVSAADPSFGNMQYIYNDEEKRYQTVNAKNDTITMYMDALGRQLEQVISPSKRIQYQYDLESNTNSQGRLSKVLISPDFYYSTTYNKFGNPDTVLLHLEGASYTQVSNYNPNQSPASLIFPDQSVQGFEYSDQGLLESISLKDGLAGSIQSFADYTNYDAKGDLLNVVYGNQVTGDYTYTPLGKIAHYTLSNSEGSGLLERTYAWNDALQIETITDELDASYTQNFSYDPVGRLLTAQGVYGSKSYTYDHSGNILLKDQVNYDYENYQVKLGTDSENTADTLFTASYDEVGNQKKRTVGEGENRTNYSYTYDVLNRLKSVEKDGSLVYAYTYDHTGRRVRKIDFINNVSSIYVSGNYEITQYKDSTVYTKNILGQNGLIATVSQSESNGATVSSEVEGLPTSGILYFHQDHIGNTKLTTSAAGIEKSRLTYQPYGQIYEPGTDGPDNFRYKFGGKELDEGANLYYFNARYYDPLTGRFITADTQLGGHPWEADVLNRYAFVLNNPVKNSDPSGHSVAGAIFTGVTIAATAVVEVGFAVATAGAAIPEEAALDAGVIAAEGTAEAALEAAGDAVIEGTTEALGEDAVDSATETLASCDCGKVNESGESMCFVAGTPVATEEGEMPIEDLRAGDKVWTWNEETGKRELHEITSTSQRVASELIEIQLGSTNITATPEHPFRIGSTWKTASMLKVGDTLYTLNKQLGIVKNLKQKHESRKVYNLQIAEVHNYWVGNVSVLVHNGGCWSSEAVSDDDNGLEAIGRKSRLTDNPQVFPNKNANTYGSEEPFVILDSNVFDAPSDNFNKVLGEREGLKFVVLEKDGSLRVGKPSITHAAIAGGEDIITGGYFRKAGNSVELLNHTGHYQTTFESLQFAPDAFDTFFGQGEGELQYTGERAGKGVKLQDWRREK